MGRKSVISANCMVHGVPFRITESKKEKDGNGKRMVSMMEPDGRPLHDKTASVRVRASDKDDGKVLKTAEKIIIEHREVVIEWLKAGLLPEATPKLLLLILPEESLKKVHGKGGKRCMLLERAVEILPPLMQLEEKMETATLGAVEKVAGGYTEKKLLKSALNRFYGELVNHGIWEKNSVSKALVVKRTTTEKADRSLRQRALSLDEMRQLAQMRWEKMESDTRYAVVLLQLTTGVSAGEACALNLSDISHYKDVVFIEVHAKTEQKRYNSVIWESYDRNSDRVRRIACTPLAQAALRALLEPRLEAKLGAGAPLIVDEHGRRIEVLAYRAFVKKVLEKVMPEYAEMTKTDILRTTFEVHCRMLCGMTTDRVKKLLGLKAEQVFEEWYADYSSHMALLALEAQLRRGQEDIMKKSGKQLNVQNNRKWGNGTCKAYDRIFFKYIAKMFDGIAYESLNRKVVEEIWQREIGIFEGDENLELRARNLFAYFVEEAYRSCLSAMTLWDNAPFEIPEDLSLLSPEQQEVLREAAERWKRRPKSLTVEAEIYVCNELFRQMEEHGECVPLLLMLLLGFRTSEAAGLSFGDIRKMSDELYSIERRYVAKSGGSREVEEGGKTDNSYRLLPLAAPLYELLEARKQRVLDFLKEAGQEHIDIDKVPLGCRGTDFLTRCTTKEMNEIFKDICRDAGVDEDTFFETEAMMAIDKEAGQEYENAVVAYILRHQFATELIPTDASRAEISVLMGHKIVNPDVKAYDFANADGQRELLRVLMQRPIYRYLCDTLEPEQNLTLPSMLDAIGRLTKEAKEHVEEGEFAEKPKILIECENPLSRLATVEDLYTDRKLMVTDMEGNLVAIGKKCKEVAIQPEKIAVCKNALYAVSYKKKQIQTLKARYHCYDGVKKSEKAMDKPQTISSVIEFHEGIAQFVVSKTGSAWYLPAEVAGKDFQEAEEWQPCRETLLAGGFVVPCVSSADSLVCAAQNGELVRLPMGKLHPWKGEKRLVHTGGTQLVSACCSAEADDLLLISARGKVLRLHVAELRMRSGLGGGMVRGMALAPDDVLCKCMIYQPKRSLTVVSQQGQILVLPPESEAQKPITAKGRGSQGVSLMTLKGSDKTADVLYAEQAVLLMLDTGYAHCRDMSRLTKCERASQGVRGTKGNRVICAVEMKIVHS